MFPACAAGAKPNTIYRHSGPYQRTGHIRVAHQELVRLLWQRTWTARRALADPFHHPPRHPKGTVTQCALIRCRSCECSGETVAVSTSATAWLVSLWWSVHVPDLQCSENAIYRMPGLCAVTQQSLPALSAALDASAGSKLVLLTLQLLLMAGAEHNDNSHPAAGQLLLHHCPGHHTP